MFRKNNNRIATLGIIFTVIFFVTFTADIYAASFQEEGAPQYKRRTRTSRPDPEGVPTKVKVGIYILDIRSVDDLRQAFTADFFLMMSWKDPRLALDPSTEPGPPRLFKMEEIWNPFMGILNELNLDRFYEDILRVDDQGTVEYYQRLQGELTTPLHLKDFPLDSQVLKIKIISMHYAPEEVEFIMDENRTGHRGTYSIPGWDYFDQIAEVTTEHIEIQDRDVVRIDFTTEVKRHIGYYIIKAILPLVLVIFMAWAVFFIPPTSLGPQIGVPTSSIFALFMFMHRIGSLLPRISYLTRMDRFILGSIALVFLTLGESILTSILALHDKQELAKKIDRWARIIYLGLFLIVLIITFIR